MGYISCENAMKDKLIRDQTFDPAYTREEATRLYQITYRKYSRGYVRVSTEKMLYMADKCFWQQFWPMGEFPGEKAWIMRNTKGERAVGEDEDEAIAMQVNQQLKQGGSQHRQNETAQGLGQNLCDKSTYREKLQTRDRAQLVYTIKQLHGHPPTSKLSAANTQPEGSNTPRESRHSSGVLQLPALLSANKLQTLDGMIEEERGIAMQSAALHELSR
ncbi:hypothetical protein DSL72_000479 [Monilinia vaccinii-corymbosi]|uniref:Uncharacterized protein n=1 Tax=Monilinia vaccinii-corymbosi TaxID=61207 RepID=A0A8A3P6F3_9HELO|nr:hypothetical protein DSL72_000479 [Monilinia vaccinii-corymbosi]